MPLHTTTSRSLKFDPAIGVFESMGEDGVLGQGQGNAAHGVLLQGG